MNEINANDQVYFCGLVKTVKIQYGAAVILIIIDRLG